MIAHSGTKTGPTLIKEREKGLRGTRGEGKIETEYGKKRSLWSKKRRGQRWKSNVTVGLRAYTYDTGG